MNFNISRDGTEIGEWAEEDVRLLYEQGQLLPTDYYWKEGMVEWKELGTLIKPPPPPAKAVPPPPPPKLTSPPPVMTPSASTINSTTPKTTAPRIDITSSETINKQLKIVGLIVGVVVLFICGFLWLIASTPTTTSSPVANISTTGNTASSSAASTSTTDDVHIDGDVLSTEMTIQNENQDAMLGEVCQRVFSLGKENGSVGEIKLLVHIQGKDSYGNPSQLDIPINLDNAQVNELRKYVDIDHFMGSFEEIAIATQFWTGLNPNWKNGM